MFYSCLGYLFSILLFALPVIAQPLAAAQFDQKYLAWKGEQEAHDLRLGSISSAMSPQTSTQKTESQQGSLPNNAAPGTALVVIHLNQANEQQLQQLKGVGEKKARAIIEYRQQHGSFQQIEELKEVKGIGESTFLKNRAQLAL